jgi:hypothetical protein
MHQRLLSETSAQGHLELEGPCSGRDSIVMVRCDPFNRSGRV